MDRKLILIAATKNKHKIEEFRGIFFVCFHRKP